MEPGKGNKIHMWHIVGLDWMEMKGSKRGKKLLHICIT
jgi:hypothetical protein